MRRAASAVLLTFLLVSIASSHAPAETVVEASRSAAVGMPTSVSVNLRDGSVWAATWNLSAPAASGLANGASLPDLSDIPLLSSANLVTWAPVASSLTSRVVGSVVFRGSSIVDLRVPSEDGFDGLAIDHGWPPQGEPGCSWRTRTITIDPTTGAVLGASSGGGTWTPIDGQPTYSEWLSALPDLGITTDVATFTVSWLVEPLTPGVRDFYCTAPVIINNQSTDPLLPSWQFIPGLQYGPSVGPVTAVSPPVANDAVLEGSVATFCFLPPTGADEMVLQVVRDQGAGFTVDFDPGDTFTLTISGLNPWPGPTPAPQCAQVDIGDLQALPGTGNAYWWRVGARNRTDPVAPRPYPLSLTNDYGWIWNYPVQLFEPAALSEGAETALQVGSSRPPEKRSDLTPAGLEGSSIWHFASDGTRLWSGESFVTASSVSANLSDGSCWVAGQGWWDGAIGAYRPAVVHLSTEGAELWTSQVDQFAGPEEASVNLVDGSCWVADAGSSEVVHLSAAGTELSRTDGFVRPVSVSVNPSDLSCWVADAGQWDEVAQAYVGGAVVRLEADGAEAWQSAPNQFATPLSVSADPSDGSCWVADSDAGDVVHLSSTGAELWRSAPGQFELPVSVSSNPSDGSCWVADNGGSVSAGLTQAQTLSALGAVVHLSSAGVELWRGLDDSVPSCVSADLDRSCWVGDAVSGEVVRLAIAFPDLDANHWAFDSVMACFAHDIVTGYGDGLYHPDWPVTRDQMAVYIARALAGGDDAVPAFTGTPTFPDVPAGFWALRYVEHAYGQRVVEGYDDGTYHPEYQVTRDQMAVYVARALVAPSGQAALDDYLPSAPHNFPDVLSDFWAYSHIEFCVENDVVQGYDDGLYHPDWVVTRDQMAVYIARAFALPAS